MTFGMMCGSLALTAACATDAPTTDAAIEELSVRKGVDYAWGRPSFSTMHHDGYSFVARYLSYDTSGKSLTHAEAQSLIHDGFDVVTVWVSDLPEVS